MTFRVERYDRDGSRLQPVPVEMRGHSITGFLNEGDQVRVSGKWEGGLLRARRADNATTGAVIEATRSGRGCMVSYTVVSLVVTLIVLGVALVIIFTALRIFLGGP